MEKTICKKCKGRGFFVKTNYHGNWMHIITICKSCKGKAKLDWVERIVGVSIGCANYIIANNFFSEFRDRPHVRIYRDLRRPNQYSEYSLERWLRKGYNN